MRIFFIYILFGAASSSVDHGFTLANLLFWRDLAAWPVVALDRVVDLGWFLSPHGQDWLMLGFAAALILYALAAFPIRFGRARPDVAEKRRRQIV